MTRLAAMRKQKGLCAAELARRLNVCRSCVSIAEKKGIRTSSAAKRYAAVLDCDWRELLE